MGTDLRCKHDASLLVEAARLHDAGLGRRAIAARLGVPHEAVRKWLVKYRAGGMELLLKMGGKQSRYDYGTRSPRRAPWSTAGWVPEAMKRFGIASRSRSKALVRLYREEGRALKNKPKKGGRGLGAKRAQDPREELDASASSRPRWRT